MVGHESLEVEKILEKNDHFQVVEKHFIPPEPEAIDMALKAIKV